MTWELGIRNFNSWINVFGESEGGREAKIEGDGEGWLENEDDQTGKVGDDQGESTPTKGEGFEPF